MKRKPPKCCYPMCENCTYEDCIWDGITYEELKKANQIDRNIYLENVDSCENLTCKQKWRLRNLEKDKENKHKNYIKNKETYIARSKRYRETHKDELAEYYRKYREEHKSEISQRHTEYMRKKRQENPELFRQKQREYRERRKIKLGVIDKDTKLTATQAKIYQFIIRYVSEHLYSPSTNEIQNEMGMKNSSVTYQLKNIERAGFISIGKGARSIKLIGYKLVKEDESVGKETTY